MPRIDRPTPCPSADLQLHLRLGLGQDAHQVRDGFRVGVFNGEGQLGRRRRELARLGDRLQVRLRFDHRVGGRRSAGSRSRGRVGADG